MSRPRARSARLYLAAPVLAALLAGCAAGRRVDFEIRGVSPLETGRRQSLAIVPFQLAGDEFDPGAEATRALTTLLEEKKLFEQMRLIEPAELPADLAEALPGMIAGRAPERIQALAGGADYVLLGRLEFTTRSHLGFIEEEYESRYSALPVKRTVRKRVTDIELKIELAAADGRTGGLVLHREKEQDSQLVAAHASIYDFFALVQPVIEKFVDSLAGETVIQKRRLLP